MPATVIVNFLTVVHKDSGGIATAFPDVCKTPSPTGPIPIPYPNIAMSSDTDKGSKKVKMDGNPIMLKGSNFKTSTGDEAGSAGGGVVSGKTKGKAEFMLYSFDVKVEGKNVPRLSDIMVQNSGSPANTPPMPEVQAPAVAIVTDEKIKNKNEEKGNIKATVIDKCDGKAIKDASVKIKSSIKNTNDGGEVDFQDLPVKRYPVKAEKRFPKCDYVIHITHYPKFTIPFTATSKRTSSVMVDDGQTSEITLKLTNFKPLEEIVFKRKYPFREEDQYGHWWIEVNGSQSYGWWPKYRMGDPQNIAHLQEPVPPAPITPDAGISEKISYMAAKVSYEAKLIFFNIRKDSKYLTLTGVEGELNGQTSFGGSSTVDPHHGDDGEDEYFPIINDCRTLQGIATSIQSFINEYEQKTTTWSWRFEFGANCHSFQIEMIKKNKLRKLRKL